VATVNFSLGDEDLRRLADAVAARIELRVERRWLTVKAAAEYTSLTEEAIRTAAKRGKLPSHRDSGRLMFRTDEIDAFMSSPE
jgi:excisionase family DNA binding protein